MFIFPVIASSLMLFNTSLAQVQTIEVYERANERLQEVKEVREQEQEERRELLQERKEEREETLARIKNERKRQIAGKVLDNFLRVNSKWTDHWMDTLSRLDAILDKLEEGYGASSDIDQARVAIDEAEAAVAAQAENEYVLEFEDEEVVGQVVRGMVAELRDDMKETRDLVQEAKEATRDAFTTIKAEYGEDDEE